MPRIVVEGKQPAKVLHRLQVPRWRSSSVYTRATMKAFEEALAHTEIVSLDQRAQDLEDRLDEPGNSSDGNSLAGKC